MKGGGASAWILLIYVTLRWWFSAETFGIGEVLRRVIFGIAMISSGKSA
jgi:hypothetical protein